MAKPINGFAVTLWIIAVLYVLVDTAYYIFGLPIGQMSPAVLFVQSTVQIVGVLFNAGQLAALGVLVELVDQIRWNNLSAEARTRRLSPREASGKLLHAFNRLRG